jgi:hypothetical protein
MAMRMGHFSSGRGNNKPKEEPRDEELTCERMAHSTSGRQGPFSPTSFDNARVPTDRLTVRMAEFSSGREAFRPTAFSTTTREATHRDVGCDNCGQSPLLGTRYKCLYCPNYDLCSSCLESLEEQSDPSFRRKPFHDTTHHFVRMAKHVPVRELPAFLQNREGMLHTQVKCHYCDAMHIKGFRYFCTQCGISLCEACELKGKNYYYFVMFMVVCFVISIGC